jgi:hypothetical protein
VNALLNTGAGASIPAFRKAPATPNVFAFFMTGYFVGMAADDRPPSLAMDPPHRRLPR